MATDDGDNMKLGGVNIGKDSHVLTLIRVCEAAREITDKALSHDDANVSLCEPLPMTEERRTIHYVYDDAIYYKITTHTVPGYAFAFDRDNRISAYRQAGGPDDAWDYLGEADRWTSRSVPMLVYEGLDKLVLVCMSKYTDDSVEPSDSDAASTSDEAYPDPFISPDGSLAIMTGSLRATAFPLDGSQEVVYPASGTPATKYAVSAAKSDEGDLRLVVYHRSYRQRTAWDETLFNRLLHRDIPEKKLLKQSQRATSASLPEGLSVAEIKSSASFIPVPITADGEIAQMVETLDEHLSVEAD